jgi:hypothetical protein
MIEATTPSFRITTFVIVEPTSIPAKYAFNCISQRMRLRLRLRLIEEKVHFKIST